jgi:hypothetical protein
VLGKDEVCQQPYSVFIWSKCWMNAADKYQQKLLKKGIKFILFIDNQTVISRREDELQFKMQKLKQTME